VPPNAREALDAHLERAEFEAAETLTQTLLDHAPTDPELLYLHAVIALRRGRPDEAIGRILRAIPGIPDPGIRAALLASLGKAYWQTEQLELATQAFEDALKLDARDVDTWIDLGVVLKTLGDPAGARQRFETALHLDPDQPDARTGLGMCCMDLGDTDRARQTLDAVLEKDPDQAEATHGLVTLDKITGRLEEAQQRLLTLLEKHPGRVGYFELVSIEAIRNPDDRILGLLESRRPLLEDPGTPDPIRIDLHYALAKAYDDLDRTEEAASHLEAGARLKRRTLRFEIQREEERLERIAHLFTPAFIDRYRLVEPVSSSRPIFIVGLPRSGSTLLEHILAAHPDITAGGEQPTLPRLATSLSIAWGRIPGFPESLLPARAETDLRDLASRYFTAGAATCLNGSPNGPITDKLLGNFMFVGLIRMAFPNARIIHMRRHPLDQALSIFQQLFTWGHHYSYDLEELGRYACAYRKLMDHWHSTLPGTLYDLAYENMVDDPETEIRQLLDFLKLPFVPACLESHQNSRVVHTASAAQVRAPIHRESIGRSRRYTPLLEPVRAVLAPWIPSGDTRATHP